MVARCHTLAVTVTSRRMTAPESGDNVLYYVDDGVYGSFSCMPFDDYRPVPVPLTAAVKARPARTSTLFGPTCDSLDCLGKAFELPVLEVGDWLYFERMGAYTAASTTRFNGFVTSNFVYVDSHPLACEEYAATRTSLRSAITRYAREREVELSASDSSDRE
eukprot:EC714714.1.p1 GENE.EC714714.1~~EC714714.1.p1  ORF type:complete len:162 (+),score=57.37 EC714714.1:2-487(+)